MKKYLLRSLYLLYYLEKTDFKEIRKYIKYVAYQYDMSRMVMFFDVIKSVYVYNVSIKDYFSFHFYNQDHQARLRWAGTGFMYEYQKKMNPLRTRGVLENKILFLKHYHPFVKRDFMTYAEAQFDPVKLDKILNNKSGKLVLKNALGQVGAEVKVVDVSDFTSESLLKYMKANKLDLIEEYIVQHPSLMALSSSGLNTVRFFTEVYEGKFHIIGARLRISVNSTVDNLAAGNIAASINLSSGQVDGLGIYSDISKVDVEIHPVTGQLIKGFKIPYWEETCKMVEKAAMYNVSNQSIGWDVAIGQNGPELVEGNHNWCKLLWQLPVKKGLKDELKGKF